MTLHKEMQ
jgi:hypothetical protein